MCNHEASHLVSVERGQMIDQGLGLQHQDWTDDNIADKKLALSTMWNGKVSKR